MSENNIVDPYDFVEEEYVPNPGSEEFSASFLEDLFGSDTETAADFEGFTREEIHLAPGSRVREYHASDGQENCDPAENTKQTGNQKAKKRKRDPSGWARNIRKKALNAGIEHRTKKGRFNYARETGPDCGCRLECFQKVSVNERNIIIHFFNGLASYDQQNVHLQAMIESQEIKRVGSQGKNGVANGVKTQKRKCSFVYWVRAQDHRRIKVCLRAFTSIYGISRQRIRTILAKQDPRDNRGTHTNRPHKISEELKQKVRDHILSFPSQESHYSRTKHAGKQYLDEKLSIQRMYFMYLQEEEPEVWFRRANALRAQQQNQPHQPPPKPRISQDFYRRIFNTEFNLGFGLPRTDTCARCEELHLSIKISSGEEKEKLEREKEEHQTVAEAGYESKRSDKAAAIKSWAGKARVLGPQSKPRSHDSIDVVTFDFEQNLPTPNLHHNDVFYSRQLWTYNFGIHDCVADQGYMCMWGENVAKRGSSEVTACLHKFFTEFRSGARSLISYSDGCTGQNKNYTLVKFLLDLQRRGAYEIINHKYLVRGHTYLENDRDFAQIERRKRTAPVLVPQDWLTVVEEAKLIKPFVVCDMKQEDIADWKEHLAEKYILNKKDTEGKAFKVTEVQWINFGWGEVRNPSTGNIEMVNHPDEVWCRKTFDKSEPWQRVKFRTITLQPDHPQRLYKEPLEINPYKVKDLLAMAEKFIPEPQRSFYRTLKPAKEKKKTTDGPASE